jgi:hypothetical protein
MRNGETDAGRGGRPLELLTQDDPSELPLQVKRWLRTAGRTPQLLIQLLDTRPLKQQQLLWGSAVRLCGDLLRPHGITWELSSPSPDLEQLAAAIQGPVG